MARQARVGARVRRRHVADQQRVACDYVAGVYRQNNMSVLQHLHYPLLIKLTK